MIGVEVFVGAGIALVVALTVAAMRSPSNVPPGVLLELPDRELMERILAREDAAFVKQIGSQSVWRYFVTERRRLALGWLRRLFVAARTLRRRHVQSARQSSDARLGSELRLAIESATFVLMYGFVVGVMRTAGPFRGRGAVGSVESLVGAVDRLGRRVAASVSVPERAVAV